MSETFEVFACAHCTATARARRNDDGMHVPVWPAEEDPKGATSLQQGTAITAPARARLS